MKPYLIILFLLCFHQHTFSQRDYKKAYLITLNHDTIKGYVQSTGIDKSVNFRSDEGASMKYSANDIYGIRISDGRYFISKQIPSLNKGNVFLEFILQGKVSLFYYKSVEGSHYFIEKNGILTEINNNKKTVTDAKGVVHTIQSNQYLGILKSYFSDSKEIVTKVDKISFTRNALIDITKDYHKSVCNDEQCIVYEKISTKKKVFLGVEAEYGNYSVNLKAQRVNVVLFETNSGNNLGFNIFARSAFGESQTFFGQVKIGYSKYSFEEKNYYSDYPSYDFKPADFKYNFSNVKSDLSLIYKYPNWRIKPVAFLGANFGYIIKEDGTILSLDKEYKFNSAGLEIQLFRGDPDRKIYGLNIGTGIEVPLNKSVLFFNLKYQYLKQTAFYCKGVQGSMGFYF